jgi:hypothetical protein
MLLTDPAVLECVNAYQKTLDAEKGKGTARQDAEQLARQDFFRTLPGLEDPESIRGHVACISYAMLFGMIDQKTGAKLLYSAQIASGSFDRY